MTIDHYGMFRPLAAWLLLAAAATPAWADLAPSQVLVVYDSRIPDSRAVAEYYAGSAQVPGGTGGRPGSRPGVRVVNLADLPEGGVVPAAADITYATFAANIRNPLRSHLIATGSIQSTRCIVLTKGLPHRIQDSDVPGAGDQPAQAGAEFNAGDVTYSSVDSELTLLWQTLNTGENGGPADSRSDGLIVNPYARSVHPITGYTTANIGVAKSILVASGFAGQIWRTLTTGATALTPGDIYLVCRLDGHTTAHVFAAIDRAHNLAVDLDTATHVLDEQNSNMIQSVSDLDQEFDNDGPVAYTNAGDDYEQTRDLLAADGRFAAANLRYDGLNNQFLVGPRVSFGGGMMVNGPVLLLASLGANHWNLPAGAGIGYADSFNYAPGAIFNTIESFNGRAFGGLTQGPTPQEQLADFIAAGGTFGIGNVWEPLSFTVGDNLALVRNFLLGDLTWAEAAYTAIPGLSWQQIVVGDPLAKVRRVKEDINGDGANDVDDLYHWASGGNRPDLNRSGAADNADWQILVRSVRGSESGKMRPPGR